MLKTCSGFTFSIQYRIEEREKIKSISIFFAKEKVRELQNMELILSFQFD